MIYLIHGADSFRAREKLNELVAEFRKKDSSGMNLSVFDADSPEGGENIASKIKAAGQAAGFLSPLRMVVIKNLFSKGATDSQKEVADFVISCGKKGGTGADFVFFEPQEIGSPRFARGEAGKKNKEFLLLAKIGKVFRFNPLSPAEMQKWVLARLKARKAKITPSALEKLILYVGNDLWRISSEIEKLSLLRAGNEEFITDDDIEALVKSDLPTNVFSTIDALARRDKKTVLKLLAGHLEKGEAPLYLLTMFVYQFRNLLKVKDAIAREKIFSAPQIAGILKLHPFVVTKTIAQAKAFDLEYLKKVYKRFLRFDFLIKKGRLNAEAALEMLVIEIGNLS